MSEVLSTSIGRAMMDDDVRFEVLTAARMKFRIVFWDILPC
jgi:hypothetical protein